MQSIVQNTKEQGDGILYLHIWKGETGSEYVYYEDDGITYQYENNNFYKRSITYNPETNSVKLSAKEGRYRSKFTKLQIVLHGFGKNQIPAREMTDSEMNVVLNMCI
jgi:alpha-glucosidase